MARDSTGNARAQGISIRAMRPADTGEVAAIAQRIMPHPWNARLFSSCLCAPYRNFVLNFNSRAIGFALLHVVFDQGQVINFGIDAPYQQQGYATWFLQHIIQPTERYWLEVRASNTAAISLYKRLGFMKVASRKDYYPLDYGREDAVVMALSF